MKIIIEGAGEVGSHLAKMLSHEANEITVVDDDAARLSRLGSTADVVTVLGDPCSLEVLKKAGAQKADLLVAVNPRVPQAVNIVSALLAKKLGTRQVTARVDDANYLQPENKLIFKDMGIDLMFYPEKIATDEIMDLLKQSSTTDAMAFGHGKLQLVVFKVDEDSPLLEMKLHEFTAAVSARGEGTEFRVIAITRRDSTIMPKFDTHFKFQDHIYIMSDRNGINDLMNFLGKGVVDIKNVMILGATRIGAMLANRLYRHVDEIKLIDSDLERCKELSASLPDPINVVCGDGRNSDFLIEESIKSFDAFVAVTGNDEENIMACVVAKKFGIERTIAEVENIEYIRLAEDMGVDAVINKKLITAGRIFKFTLSDKVRFVKYMSGTDAEVLEYTVAPGCRITKGALKDIDFPANAIIGGVTRGSDAFIAVGSTRIEAYDRVAVFALPEAVKEVDRWFK